jgi:hypothetical protein
MNIMKNIYKNVKLLVILVFLLLSCSEDILDKKPLDSYSDPTVWSDIDLAGSYLISYYNKYGWGNYPYEGENGWQSSVQAGETTWGKGGSIVVYNSGAISADNLGTKGLMCAYLSWEYYSDIQSINLFLDKIDHVSDSYKDSEKEQIKAQTDVLKGEALFLRAAFYCDICRSYGGVPLLSKPAQLGDDFSSITRATFEETIDFIVKDCDDAAALLPLKGEQEMGRGTKEAALALKSRILLFAASDLTADGTAENKLVGYLNPNRTGLWIKARDAAKAVMDLGTCQLADFGAPDQEAVAKNYFEFFKAYDLSSPEVIFGKMHRKDVGSTITTNRLNGPNGINNFSNNCPFQNIVDEYEMTDGSKYLNHFKINNEEYINTSAKFHYKNPYYDREPRFYGTILYDSAVWQPRFSNLADIDPIGIYDRRTRREIVNGKVINERYGLDTRQGPVEPWNGSYTGYVLKKFMDDKIIGRDENNESITIFIRYAEVLLNYAESLLELGDIQTASIYINMIRNRAGLPNFTGDITQALRHERQIEFFAENIRWYDIRRWKILEEALSPRNYGIDILEINNKDEGTITTTWKRIIAQPDNHPQKKMYWIPIASAELQRAPQLIQNPGY